MSETVFSIAENFSANPGPRLRRQGPHSGEVFRTKLLELLEATGGRIRIVLDGTKGMGSSFLDEAFGGLIRYHGRTKDELLGRFEFISKVDPSYVDTIRDAIDRAERESGRVH